jgi:lipocalin
MGIKNPTLSNNNDLVRVKADYRKINNEQVLAIKKKKEKKKKKKKNSPGTSKIGFGPNLDNMNVTHQDNYSLFICCENIKNWSDIMH